MQAILRSTRLTIAFLFLSLVSLIAAAASIIIGWAFDGKRMLSVRQGEITALIVSIIFGSVAAISVLSWLLRLCHRILEHDYSLSIPIEGAAKFTTTIMDFVWFIQFVALSGYMVSPTLAYKTFTRGLSWTNYQFAPWDGSDAMGLSVPAGTPCNSSIRWSVDKLLIGTLILCLGSWMVMCALRLMVLRMLRWKVSQQQRMVSMQKEHEQQQPPVFRMSCPPVLLFPRWEVVTAMTQYFGIISALSAAAGSGCDRYVVGGGIAIALYGLFCISFTILSLNRTPLFVTYHLFKNENRVDFWSKMWSSGVWVGKSRVHQYHFVSQIDPLLGQFTPLGLYHGVVITFTRTAFAAILSISDVMTRSGIALTLLSLEIASLLVFRPYRNRARGVKDFVSACLKWVIIGSGVLSVRGSLDAEWATASMLTFALLGLALHTCCQLLSTIEGLLSGIRHFFSLLTTCICPASIPKMPLNLTNETVVNDSMYGNTLSLSVPLNVNNNNNSSSNNNSTASPFENNNTNTIREAVEVSSSLLHVLSSPPLSVNTMNYFGSPLSLSSPPRPYMHYSSPFQISTTHSPIYMHPHQSLTPVPLLQQSKASSTSPPSSGSSPVKGFVIVPKSEWNTPKISTTTTSTAASVQPDDSSFVPTRLIFGEAMDVPPLQPTTLLHEKNDEVFVHMEEKL